jgi:glucokinase
MRILAGDIGGTNTRLALFEDRQDRLDTVREASYPSGRYGGLEEVIAGFLADGENSCERACFGVAGPVHGRRVRTTNLPWVVDADEIAERFGFGSVTLVNDLEAVAWGVELLGPPDVIELNPGRSHAVGNRAVIAAGTGLGEAGLYWDGHEHRPFACEGGHASFSPTTPEDVELLRFLRLRFDHVSWERVVSGPGLEAIHAFVVASSSGSVPRWLADRIEASGATRAVVEAGLSGRCELCARTVGLFVRLYGSEAGNLALKIMATGGVYLAGGMAAAISPALGRGEFMEGFAAKGRMRPLLEAMPVRVVTDERVGLMGAARCGRRASVGNA